MAPPAAAAAEVSSEPWERAEATEGMWGRHTATIDWCEYNYEV